MTSDRLAQENEIRVHIRRKPHLYASLYVHSSPATPGEILSLVKELGYRKLPKDKPPLLVQEDCHQVNNPGDWNMGAEEQRDTDIRHYEGSE